MHLDPIFDTFNFDLQRKLTFFPRSQDFFFNIMPLMGTTSHKTITIEHI